MANNPISFDVSNLNLGSSNTISSIGSNLPGVGGAFDPAKPFNNTLSLFDNEVEETEKGKSGFVNSIMSGGISAASLQDKAKNLASSVSGKVGTFLSDGIAKLNTLASGLLGKIPGLDGLLNKLNGFLGSKLGSLTNLLKTMLNDTIKQLENAAINYISNIIEDFTKNLVSSLFIPDKVFCETIKALYKAGADLAYDKHYIRNMALSRDWVHTLEFIDSQYGIKYNKEYKYLESDIVNCSTNSCADNLFYIYKKVIASIEEYKGERLNYLNTINYIKDAYPDDYTKRDDYLDNLSVVNQLDNDISSMEEMIVSNLAVLIINSYTYVTVSKIEKFFKDLPGDYLLPKYFGSTDDKYNKRFAFSEGDCKTMMPDFKSHQTTESDKRYLENVNNDKAALKEQAQNAMFEAQMNSEIYDLSKDYISDSEKARLKVNEKIETLRANMSKTQMDRYGVLSSAAIKGGSTEVYKVSRNRYPKQNDLPESVKYKKKVTGAVGASAKAFLYDDTEYITLNNKNIKEIYIYLSSNAIFGNNRMVNEAFYQRCKIPTMTTLKASLDKAKGIIGASMGVQAMFDLQDAIDRTAYDYTQKMEGFLLDPAKNIDDIKNALGALTFQVDPSNSDLPVATDENGVPITPGSVNVSNPTTVSEMDAFLDANPAINQEIIAIIRYAANIPMTTMRDTIIKWLTYFYNFMNKKSIANASISHSFLELSSYVFAATDITEPTGLVKLFNSSTKESLLENIKVLVFIYKAYMASKAMKLDEIAEKDTIANLFYLCMSMFAREISDIGFVKSLLEYDKEFLKTYLKSYYWNEIDFLKGINDRSRLDYKMFYPYKDKLTTRFEGFDKFGIFGYNENLERLQYTNVITGDWKVIFNSTRGMFFGGTENTKNNGIKRLNSDKSEVISTNISDGNWIDIFEFYGVVFFVRDTDELYYWTGSRIESTGIKDYSNWEVKGIDAYSVILLLGKNNNGLRRWNNGSFLAVTNNGDGWFIQKCNYFGYVVYPTNNVSNPVFVNRSKQFTVLNLTDRFTYVAETTRTVTVTGQVQEQKKDPTTNTMTTVEVTKSKSSTAYYVFLGTHSNGLKIYSSTGSANAASLSHYTESNPLRDIPGLVIPNYVSRDSIHYIRNDGEYSATFEISLHTSAGQVTSESQLIIYPQQLELEVENTTKLKAFNNVTSMRLTPRNFLVHDSGDNRNYNKVIETNTIYDFDSTKDISNGEYYVFDPNETVYWKFNDGKGLYRVDNSNFTPLMNENDIEKTGWKMYYFNNKLFATNFDEPLGIRVYNNGIFTETNIAAGYWIIGCSSKRYFALSTKNTNMGIKVCGLKSTSYDFTEIPKTNITYGDYSGIAFDKESNKIFISAERSDLVMNLDMVNYDIDAFIYPLHEYVLQQLISYVVSDKLTILTEFIIMMIENGLDSFILSSVLNEKLMNITVNGKTLRSALMTITDEAFINKLNSTSNPLNKARYILDNIHRFFQLLPYQTPIEEFLQENRNFVDIFGIMNQMEAFSRDMQRKSALYTELLTHAEAKREFDMGDNKAIDSIILDFLNSIRFNGNIEEYYNALARYKGDNVKIYGLVDYDRDGNQITIDKNSPEYKREHYYDSEEFMNSDEDGSY